MTREEEELVLEEMRFAEEQQKYGRSQPLRSVSNGAPSQRTASAVSDWDGNPPPMEGDWNSVRRQGESSLRGSSSVPRFGTSDGTLSPGISPSNSGNVAQGNYTSLDEFVHERSKMQGRSYGFSGNTSFRDNNYLLKVQKSHSKTGLDDYHDGLSSPSNSLRPPISDSDGASLISGISSRRPSNGSHRTLTPQPPQQATMPTSGSTSSLAYTNDKSSPTDEAAEEMLAEEAEPEDEAFMSPLTRAASTIRRNPSVNSQGRKRQSMLIGMSPAQAKRVSVALLEIESHLRRSTLIEVSNTQDGHHQEAEADYDDREEMLEGDDSFSDRELERQQSITSTSGASSVFPYHASSSSTEGPISPATHHSIDNAFSPVSNQHRHLESPSSNSSLLLHNIGQPMTGQAGTYRHASNPSHSSSLVAAGSHQASHSISSTVYSEEQEAADSPREMTLVPTRPQPARHTPSPAFGVGGYVPGQPRPVGSMRQASISSNRSEAIGSPASSYASPPQVSDPLAKKPQYPPVTANRPPQNRSVSQPQTSASNSRSHTPTGRVDHVPAPGALASRHQQSSSFSDTFGWRSGSALAMYSPTRVINEGDERPFYSNGSVTPSAARDHSPQPMGRSSPSAGNHLLPTPARRADSVISCGSTYAGPTDDSSPWSVILNERETVHINGDDQEQADLELLKSMSGVGKEELSLMQGALVEKAKHERNRLRSDQTIDMPPATPSVESSRSASRRPTIGGSPAVTDKSGGFSPKGALSPSNSMPDMTSETSKPLQPVLREQASVPGSLRPPHQAGSAAASSPDVTTTTHGHDRSASGARKWIDDDPEAKRDIEKRIANATSELFRAPSRNAHKRSLSKSAKKAISTPTLVSYSATVPTVPIAQEEEKTKKKHKLSLRWKKKKRSLSGTPELPMQSPTTATSLSSAAKTPTEKVPPTAYKSPTPVNDIPTPASLPSPAAAAAAKSAEKDKKQESTVSRDVPAGKANGSQTTLSGTEQAPVQRETPPTSAATAPRQPSADLNGFRFPRAPTTAPNGTATPPVAQRQRTISQVVEMSRKTHRSTGSEDTVAINRFFEAGRAIGLDDDQLHVMIRQNNRTSAARSYHSTAPTTTSFSHSASLSHTHSRSLSQSLQSASPISPTFSIGGQGSSTMGRIPSPIAENGKSHDMQPQSSIEPAVLRRTIVMVNEGESSDGLQRQTTPTGQPPVPDRPDRSPKRGNSIRRKPIQLNTADRELVARSPTSRHSRGFSGHSGVSETLELPPRRIYDDTPPNSAGQRSSMNQSTQGSIYDDYYSRDSPRRRSGSVGGGERGSQAVEIT